MGQQEWRHIEGETLGYSIEERVEQPEPYTFDNPITVTAYFVSWSLWALYLSCRFWNLAHGDEATAASWWVSALLFLTEILLLLPDLLSALHMSLYICFGTAGKHRSSYRLTGQEAPSIDVCITCCGEQLDVIMDTVAGATSQDYPRTSFRVFVLDDAGDEALEKAIQDYNQSRGTAVTYLARTKLAGESHFYKAGNLRFGLATTERAGKGSVFFASLDVDMIAEPDWLRRVIPHLILDPKLALACPAQVRMKHPLKSGTC
jgi:cellulose synthase/poly-beta-1,6-N-acetylglucosamine synthase-like glycosyltransferase